MRKIALTFAVAALFALGAMAQDAAQSSSGTASSGQMSSTTTTSKKHSKSSGKVKTEHQVTGCLSGPNAEGTYTLTNGRYKKGLEVGGNDSLKDHVGHEVTLIGTWAKGSEIGENEKNESTATKTEEKVGMHKHFAVTDIKMVSDKCTDLASKSSKKKSKKSST